MINCLARVIFKISLKEGGVGGGGGGHIIRQKKELGLGQVILPTIMEAHL